ncbi:MAG: hypothetical protein KDE03_00825 [Rhodobacteraceae bacterium]|nr:hypothetical protein [Paracoccaceae bacterium]
MNEIAVMAARIRAGVWEAVIAGGDVAPELEVTYQDEPLGGLAIEPAGEAGQWRLRLPIPASLLGDGVQTFLLRDRQSGETLDRFTIVTGVPLEDDLRAEIDLLRAELDMLKKAFRRHCLETGGR